MFDWLWREIQTIFNLLLTLMEDITTPFKKRKRFRPKSTPAPPTRATRLQKEVELVANECEKNVQSLRSRKKALTLKFKQETELLDVEVMQTVCCNSCMLI